MPNRRSQRVGARAFEARPRPNLPPTAASKDETRGNGRRPTTDERNGETASGSAGAARDEPGRRRAPGGARAPRPPSDSSNRDDGPPDDELLARVPAHRALRTSRAALLSKRCGKCHSGEKPAARLRIDDYRRSSKAGSVVPASSQANPTKVSFAAHRLAGVARRSHAARRRASDDGGRSRSRTLLGRAGCFSRALAFFERRAGSLRAAAEYVPAAARADGSSRRWLRGVRDRASGRLRERARSRGARHRPVRRGRRTRGSRARTPFSRPDTGKMRAPSVRILCVRRAERGRQRNARRNDARA